jgi:acyl-CoA synthetase (NDP forming)
MLDSVQETPDEPGRIKPVAPIVEIHGKRPTVPDARSEPLAGFDRMRSIDDSFFRHSSVAIAGVSAEYNVGQAFVECLLDSGFRGRVYPLNPIGGQIRGIQIYRSIADVPEQVDYAISCIPARLTPQLVRDCAAKGAKTVAFFTAGYSETGRWEGRELEAELLRLARANSIRLLGPNCLGLYCPETGLSFASDFPREKGSVGFISQSGGNAIYLIRAAGERGIRFSRAVSYGNACDVDECDLLEYFTNDDETEVVCAYIEGVKNGRRFPEVLRKLCSRKPMIILRGGSTEGGAVAAESHTGSLAGTSESWEALMHQTGAIPVRDLDEMADMLVTFCSPVRPQGRKIVICGGGGGFSVLSADHYIEAGFALPQLPPKEQREIHSQVARFANTDAGMILRNPFDISNISSPDCQYAVMRSLAVSKRFSTMVAQVAINNSGWPSAQSPSISWPGMFLDTLLRVHREVGKPVAVVLHGSVNPRDFERLVPLRQKCQAAGLPVYDSLPRAALAMDRFLLYEEEPRSLSRAPDPLRRCQPQD